MFAALADGAGSAEFAEEGAQIAVTSAMEHLDSALRIRDVVGPDDLRAAANAARDAIARQAGEHSDVRAYACTLLLVALSDTGGAALQIGDGLIAVNQGQDGWEWVFWPQRGEFANTTFFLTDVGAAEQLEVTELPSFVLEFALMSDGLEGLALDYAAESAHSPFFEGLFPALRKEVGHGERSVLSEQLFTHFLMSERVRKRTDDDLSLVLVARDSPVVADPW